MLRTRWYKVLSDLWKNRTRTMVVALAVAVGVYAVGVVLNVREVLVREYELDQTGARLAAAIIYTSPFDAELAERVSDIPGIEQAEGRRTLRALVDRGQDKLELELVVVPDFANMQVDTITPLQGVWPLDKREITLELRSPDYLGVVLGDSIAVELDNDEIKELTVVGIAHDAQRVSPNVSGRATGYITLDTLGYLGYDKSFTELRIRVDGAADDKKHIQTMVDRVGEHLERTGRQVVGKRIITESIADPYISTIILILSSFGVVILLLSGFLVINSISALITQQIPHIGVMKLVGARRRQIISLYVVTILAYGLVAIALAIPLAAVTARILMTVIVEALLNVLPDSHAVPAYTLVVQAAVGLLLPLIAGMVPVFQGTQITTRKALTGAGVASGGYSSSWIERLIDRLKGLMTLQRTLLLAVRNTLRHKARLFQTLIVLIVGTALFISVISLWSSVNATLDGFMRYHHYDVSIGLENPERIARLGLVAEQVPDVVAYEGWSLGSAVRQRPDGSESDGLRVYAIPINTALMAPEVIKGQWLDGRAYGVVVNSDVLDREDDIHVGDDLVLEIDGREATWHVQGIAPTEARGPALYVGLEDYAYVTRTPNQVTHLQVVTTRHDADFQQEMETVLRQHLEDQGLPVRSTTTTKVLQAENKLLFDLVVSFLILMALLLGGVGGLGLTTTMSINIMERVREIGVLRAIGASNISVRQIVLVEGVVIGIVSWLVGTIVSLVISPPMSRQLGIALIDVPLAYRYSALAAAAWFFALQGIAIAASLGPARDAVRLTIREVLAYE